MPEYRHKTFDNRSVYRYNVIGFLQVEENYIQEGNYMDINIVIERKGISKYMLSKRSGIPHSTLTDICSGKTKIEKCSAETIYKLSHTLEIPMEMLIRDAVEKTIRERSFEYGLPSYLQRDLDEYKKAVKNQSSLLDCLWSELYGSINMAEVSDGLITHEHAEYLRNKYLRR